MNCMGIANKWSTEERELLFELLTHLNDPIYIRVGENKDHVCLNFLDIMVVRKLLRAMTGKPNYHYMAFRMRRSIWATKAELKVCKKMLDQINRHILISKLKRLVRI